MTQSDFSDKLVAATKRAKSFILSKYNLADADMQDIIQEASLKAIRNRDSFLGKCSFNTWFIAICKNEIKYFFRKNKRQDIFIPQDDKQRELGWDEPEVKRKSDIEESFFLLNQVISKLSDKHRQVIELVLKNSSTSKEIADLLDIPINSARTRLFYAKRHLKKLIEVHAHKSDI